jgi:hypothetical protein
MGAPVVSSLLLRQITAMQADIAVFAVGIFARFFHAIAPLAVYGSFPSRISSPPSAVKKLIYRFHPFYS